MFSKKDTTRKLGTWPDPVTADIAAGTLKASGIDCEVRNTLLWSAAGELPPDICAPEIWLTDARDTARAPGQFSKKLPENAEAPAWVCPNCGETIEAQFGQCWKCATVKPAKP